MAFWPSSQHQLGRHLKLGFLFLLEKMGQDPIDDVPLLDASDDFYRSAAAAADFDVY